MSSRIFPSELIQAQIEWNRTYTALSSAHLGITELRQRLLRLSRLIASHPFLSSRPDGSPALRVELRRAARAAAQTQHGVQAS